MSGDNLHGKQPIKFYSEEITISKLLLIKRHFDFNYEKTLRTQNKRLS